MSQPVKTMSSSLARGSEVFDERGVVVGAFAQPDGAHLREGADGLGESAADGFYSGDQGGGDGSHAHNHHSQFARGGRNRLCSSGGLAAALLTRHLLLVLSKSNLQVGQRLSLRLAFRFGKWDGASGVVRNVNGVCR